MAAQCDIGLIGLAVMNARILSSTWRTSLSGDSLLGYLCDMIRGSLRWPPQFLVQVEKASTYSLSPIK